MRSRRDAPRGVSNRSGAGSPQAQLVVQGQRTPIPAFPFCNVTLRGRKPPAGLSGGTPDAGGLSNKEEARLGTSAEGRGNEGRRDGADARQLREGTYRTRAPTLPRHHPLLGGTTQAPHLSPFQTAFVQHDAGRASHSGSLPGASGLTRERSRPGRPARS